MAQYYWNSGLSWSQYLQTNSFVQDVNKTIQKTGKATQYTITEQTKDLVASNEALSREFGRSFNQINSTIAEGFGIIGEKFDGLNQSIEGLGARFEWGLSRIAAQLEIQNDLLSGIQERLDAIHQTLQTPALTQAREFYAMGIERLKKGLWDKALEAFLKAEEKNDVDFMIQYLLGHLYLYGRDKDCNIVDLPKAEKHFCEAARYAKIDLFQIPDMRKYLGMSYFHASIACYVQAKEHKQRDDVKRAKTLLEKSKNLGKDARNIYPELQETFYHYAKLCALTDDPVSAINNLRSAIKLDRAYCLKVGADPDFGNVTESIVELFEALKYEAKQAAIARFDEIRSMFQKYVFMENSVTTNVEGTIKNLFHRVDTLCQKDTYFDYLDALKPLDEAERVIQQADKMTQEKFKTWKDEQKRQTETDKRKEEQRRQDEQRRQENELKQKRIQEGCCTTCGKKLSFFTKLMGKSRCKYCA